MGSEHYCLRWNNHQTNLLGVFSQLLRDESLVDVTLACSEGHSIRAHKVVLSACSSYFRTLFIDHPSRHPIVILKDVRFNELRTLVEFMYKGEVNVEYCQLSALLKTAESLKIKGLAEMTRKCAKTEPIDEEDEQTEPTELTTKKSNHYQQFNDDEPMERIDQSQHDNGKTPPESAKDHSSNHSMVENLRSESPAVTNSPSDLTVHNSTPVTSSYMDTMPPICNRLSPPINTESLPGTSSALPPIQQVPLSLKKEVDWGGDTEKRNSKDLPETSRSLDSDLDESTMRYACIYCRTSYSHKDKLTRHILSHSLETLKYLQHPHMIQPEASAFTDTSYGVRVPSVGHEPPDNDQIATQIDMEVGDATSSSCVLCKFCGKSFPDVSSLIGHLPVHTGDRPFKCEFCGKAFKLRHHMKDHCRVHTGERPFRCALCGKTFSRSTILKAHEKTHYPKYVRKFLSPSPLDAEEDNPH